MKPNSVDRREAQEQRLKVKTQDQQLRNLVVEGTQISPWEAQVLVDAIHQVYFQELDNQPHRTGQIRYTCADAREGAGKPVVKLAMVNVTLAVLADEDRDVGRRYGAAEMRRHRLVRLADEARQQHGLLTQEDLAALLSCDERTIRRDVAVLRKRGIVVPTRGQQRDIGPSVTHREVAVGQWLKGKEPLEIANAIKHTLTSVERYLHTFSRLAFLVGKGFNNLELALTLGISTSGVASYRGLFESVRRTQGFRLRRPEIDVIGGDYYHLADHKKGILLPSPEPPPSGGKR